MEQGRNTGAGDNREGGRGGLLITRTRQKRREGFLGTRRTPVCQTPAEPDPTGPSGLCWSLCDSAESWQAEAERSEGSCWLQLALTHTWGQGCLSPSPSPFFFPHSFPVHVGFSSVSSEPALLTILPNGCEPDRVEERALGQEVKVQGSELACLCLPSPLWGLQSEPHSE